jgi:uncharacterized membrane protein
MHDLLHRLVAEFSLPADKASRLWRLSKLHKPSSALGKHIERGLIAVSALLLGAALIFWVAANWQDQTRQFKLYLIQALLLASLSGAFVLLRIRNAFLLLATLALGGLLAFVGQTYQTGADPWQLFAIWGALALLWMLAARSDALWAIWVLIVGMGIALWSGNQLLNPLGNLVGGWRNKNYLAPLLWVLLALSMAQVSRLIPPRDGFVTRRYAFRLAVLLSLSAWCTYGVSSLLESMHSLYLLNALLVLCTAAIAWRNKPHDVTVLALALMALDVLFFSASHTPPICFG